MSDRKWVDVPKIERAELRSRKVTGTVGVTFNGSGKVSAHGDSVVFRGKTYQVSVHFERAADGTFVPGTGVYASVRSVNSFTFDEAPRTFKAAMIAAVADTVGELWTVELDEQARRARASQQLGQLESNLRDAESKVAEIRAAMLPLRRLLGELS